MQLFFKSAIDLGYTITSRIVTQTFDYDMVSSTTDTTDSQGTLLVPCVVGGVLLALLLCLLRCCRPSNQYIRHKSTDFAEYDDPPPPFVDVVVMSPETEPPAYSYQMSDYR
jgi:hypothetical protein